MTQTAEEMAAVLDCVAGPDGFDPRQSGLPSQLRRVTETLSQGIRGLRIGLLTEAIEFEGNDAGVKETVLQASSTLEAAGARVEEISVPLHDKGWLALLPLISEGLKRIFDTNLGGAFAMTYYPTSLIIAFGRFKKAHGHEFGPNMKTSLLVGTYLERLYQSRLYARAQNVRPTFIKAYNDALARVDILAMPTVPVKAPAYVEPHDYVDAFDRTLYGGERGLNVAIVSKNIAPFNLTGHPALTIPWGRLTVESRVHL